VSDAAGDVARSGSILDGLKAKITNIGIALKGVGSAIKGAFISHPILAVTAGVIAAAAAIAIHAKRVKEALK